jgi:hypothetical protein
LHFNLDESKFVEPSRRPVAGDGGGLPRTEARAVSPCSAVVPPLRYAPIVATDAPVPRSDLADPLKLYRVFGPGAVNLVGIGS